MKLKGDKMAAYSSFFGFFLKIFRKIKRKILKKILFLINPRIRKRLMAIGRLRKKQKLLIELSAVIEGRTAPKTLWRVVSITQGDLQKKVLNLFLEHPDLSLDDIFDAAENVSPDDEKTQDVLWNKATEMGLTPEDLLDISAERQNIFQKRAWNAFTEMIKRGQIRKNRARKILTMVMDEIPKLRIPIWRLLKTLDPTSEELKKILDAKWMYTMPGLATEIEQRIRKIYQREKIKDRSNKRMEKRIKKIIGKIQGLE